MALRVATKIKSNLLQNLSRAIFTKPEVITSTRGLAEDADAAVQQLAPAAEESTSTLTSSGPYSVCKTRAARFQSNDEEDGAVINGDMQQLQPSRLPEYLKPPTVQAGTYPGQKSAQDGNNKLAVQGPFRRFEASNTHRSVTLPLKIPKLASPFPEPVKIMSSHTVSDHEKAEQMFAESRVPKGITATSLDAVLTRPQTRNYSKKSKGGKTVSVNADKCKKLKPEKKKKTCKKMISPNCKPPKTIDCTKDPKRVECQKIYAPYPSYSESCYKDPVLRPSECRTCPWKPDEHPYFKKPKKKKYHTSAAMFYERKPECEKGPDQLKKPCGWQKDDKKKSKTSIKSNKKKDDKKKKSSEMVLEHAAIQEPLEINGESRKYFFDVRKKPCKQPPPSPCGEVKKSGKKKKKEKDKKKGSKSGKKQKQKSKGKKKDKKNKKKALPWITIMENWRESASKQEPEWIDLLDEPLALCAKSKKKDKKKEQKPACRKMPFDPTAPGGNKKKKKKDAPKKKGKVQHKHRMLPCKPKKIKPAITCPSKKDKKKKDKKKKKGKSKKDKKSKKDEKQAVSSWQTLETIEQIGDEAKITQIDNDEWVDIDKEYRLASGCQGGKKKKEKCEKGKKKDGKKKKSKKDKCKGIKGGCKKKKEEDDDPCGKKKKPQSRICPGDLTDKPWYKHNIPPKGDKVKKDKKKDKKDKKKKDKKKKADKKKCDVATPLPHIPASKPTITTV